LALVRAMPWLGLKLFINYKNKAEIAFNRFISSRDLKKDVMKLYGEKDSKGELIPRTMDEIAQEVNYWLSLYSGGFDPNNYKFVPWEIEEDWVPEKVTNKPL
jgi:hypothetical protein